MFYDVSAQFTDWFNLNISIHVDLLLLKSVMRYVKCKVDNAMLPNELYFVEYHVGLQLAKRFGFRVNNSTPHASQPNTVYSYILEIICVYDISRDELELGSVNKIYKRIIFKLTKQKWYTKS